MKSLEILEHVKNAPGFMGEDIRYKGNMNSSALYSEDIETIKLDLEVLEIIKNKIVDVCYLGVCINNNYPIEEQLKYYNRKTITSCKLTMEELLKLKQWLEVNENER